MKAVEIVAILVAALGVFAMCFIRLGAEFSVGKIETPPQEKGK